jgi:hypothetical protein
MLWLEVHDELLQLQQEHERNRCAFDSAKTPDSDAILGGAETAEDEEGDVVAVFGEIVEVSNLPWTVHEMERTECES